MERSLPDCLWAVVAAHHYPAVARLGAHYTTPGFQRAVLLYLYPDCRTVCPPLDTGQLSSLLHALYINDKTRIWSRIRKSGFAPVLEFCLHQMPNRDVALVHAIEEHLSPALHWIDRPSVPTPDQAARLAQIAARCGNLPALQQLIQLQFLVDYEEAFLMSMMFTRWHVTRHLLQEVPICMSDHVHLLEWKQIALDNAVVYGQLELVQRLVKQHGFQCRDVMDRSLKAAEREGHQEMVQYVLETREKERGVLM